jgi:hypothetical protein
MIDVRNAEVFFDGCLNRRGSSLSKGVEDVKGYAQGAIAQVYWSCIR